MTTTVDPFVAMLETSSRKKRQDYSPGLAPDKVIEDLKRQEAEREYQRELLRSWRKGPASPPDAHPPPLPEKPKSARPDFADDIDRLVADLVRAGDVVYEVSTDQYRRPHCRRWRFE